MHIYANNECKYCIGKRAVSQQINLGFINFLVFRFDKPQVHICWQEETEQDLFT